MILFEWGLFMVFESGNDMAVVVVYFVSTPQTEHLHHSTSVYNRASQCFGVPLCVRLYVPQVILHLCLCFCSAQNSFHARGRPQSYTELLCTASDTSAIS